MHGVLCTLFSISSLEKQAEIFTRAKASLSLAANPARAGHRPSLRSLQPAHRATPLRIALLILKKKKKEHHQKKTILAMHYLHPFCKAVEVRGDFFPHARVRCSSHNELSLMLRNIFGLNAVSQGLAVNWSWDGRDSDCLLPRACFQPFQ